MNLGAGTDFDGFPFPPYPIQQDLMEALYSLLQKGGIGLFESPTGKCARTKKYTQQILLWNIYSHTDQKVCQFLKSHMLPQVQERL